jgi:Protein of unknown function (DUF4232)
MLAPPKPLSHDELEALIKEARARQLRRRLLAAGALAVAAAIGLTVYALTAGQGGRSSAANGLPSGTAPLCRSSRLAVAAIWDGAGGNLFNFFTVTNKGGSACSLPLGRPTVLLTRNGSQLKVEERAFSHNFYPGKPVHTLAPGGRAVVHLDWWNWCGPHVGFAQTTTTVTARFAGGLRVTAPHLLGQPPCINPAQPSVLSVGTPLKPSVGER